MINLVRVRAAVNQHKRILTKDGTAYRKSTAVYASRFLNDLVSSKTTLGELELQRHTLRKMLQSKFELDKERAMDVAKFVDVHLRSDGDAERLADVYAEVDALLQS